MPQYNSTPTRQDQKRISQLFSKMRSPLGLTPLESQEMDALDAQYGIRGSGSGAIHSIGKAANKLAVPALLAMGGAAAAPMLGGAAAGGATGAAGAGSAAAGGGAAAAGGINNLLMGGAVGLGSIYAGGQAADAATDAAGIQADAAEEARLSGEAMSLPYRQLGQQNIGSLQNLINNSTGYLQDNPMFNAALNSANEQSRRNAALTGTVGSGGMVNSLFQNYLGLGDQFINSQYNRLLNPVKMGQAAAAGQAVNSGNLITGGANALAAGKVGAANAQQQVVSDIANIAGLNY